VILCPNKATREGKNSQAAGRRAVRGAEHSLSPVEYRSVGFEDDVHRFLTCRLSTLEDFKGVEVDTASLPSLTKA
jgi:hypothetical protein